MTVFEQVVWARYVEVRRYAWPRPPVWGKLSKKKRAEMTFALIVADHELERIRRQVQARFRGQRGKHA